MNAKKLNTKLIATLGIFSALSVVMALLIHFPIFPQARYLEYDPADVPIFLITFMYGPYAGLIVTAVVSIIQGVTVSAGSGPIGILMHFVSTGIYVLIAGLIYKKKRTFKGALLSVTVGSVVMIGVMVVMNILLTPIYTGMPRSAVIGMILPIILPFNAVKIAINSVLTVLLYKRTKKLVGFLWQKTDDANEKRLLKKNANGSNNFENNKGINYNSGMEFVSNSIEDTARLARQLANDLEGGEIIVLDGDLGAGKTTFTKALGLALGVEEEITSPTFLLMKEYSGRTLKLYHFDLYRINDASEIEELGFSDYLADKNGICVIEWNKFPEFSEAKVINIRIESTGESSRRFTVS